MLHTLIVVAKRPTAGHTKTRLCPPLSGEQAAALYECFLRDTLDTMRRVRDVRRTVAYLVDGATVDSATQGDEARHYFHTLAPDMVLKPQRGNDLGERLHHLLCDALDGGAHSAVVMDSDSPSLPHAYLTMAYEMLDDCYDVVLGPCDDGGYYLIGLKQPQRRLLCEVKMSTPNVLRDTLAIAAELKLRTGLLPVWYDVDTVAELERLGEELARDRAGVAPHTRGYLSSIGPAGRNGHASLAGYSGAE
jgi:uncharacterized protein